MRPLFWFSVVFVFYVYVGYPLLVALWAKMVTRPEQRRGFSERHWPSISIIIAARNEAGRLPARIRNLLDQAYPGDRELILVSDGSVDQPASALAQFENRIRLLELPAGGKPLALNAGVASARGDILVFADARQSFAPGALVELVSNFADPSVGGVTGELILDGELNGNPQSDIGAGVNLYWRYEKWIRRSESQVRSTLGATGAITHYGAPSGVPYPNVPCLTTSWRRCARCSRDFGLCSTNERSLSIAPAPTRRSKHDARRDAAGNYQILGLEPRLLLPTVNPVWFNTSPTRSDDSSCRGCSSFFWRSAFSWRWRVVTSTSRRSPYSPRVLRAGGRRRCTRGSVSGLQGSLLPS